MMMMNDLEVSSSSSSSTTFEIADVLDDSWARLSWRIQSHIRASPFRFQINEEIVVLFCVTRCDCIDNHANIFPNKNNTCHKCLTHMCNTCRCSVDLLDLEFIDFFISDKYPLRRLNFLIRIITKCSTLHLRWRDWYCVEIINTDREFLLGFFRWPLMWDPLMLCTTIGLYSRINW